MATKVILFFFGCSEVNSTWLITSKLANQRARKVLFTCVYILTKNILDEEIPEIDSRVLRATSYVKKPEPLEETDRKQEIRELEEMLGLRSSKKRASAPALPGIKITDSMELEREGKINRIKEINRQSRPQFRISQTGSALRGFESQLKISPRLSSLEVEVLNLKPNSSIWRERIARPARF